MSIRFLIILFALTISVIFIPCSYYSHHLLSLHSVCIRIFLIFSILIHSSIVMIIIVVVFLLMLVFKTCPGKPTSHLEPVLQD